MRKPLSQKAGISRGEFLAAWRKILAGRAPMLSIENTRYCPLTCPGCYAYGENHLGDGVTLRQLSDFRGDALVEGVLGLVRRHRPIHVSLVGGEPMIRHRELSRILPALAQLGVYTLLVTSGVIPLPKELANQSASRGWCKSRLLNPKCVYLTPSWNGVRKQLHY